MDRDLGKLSKSLARSNSLARSTTCAVSAHASPDLPTKQIRRHQSDTRYPSATPSNAHDKDGTFNKEFYR